RPLLSPDEARTKATRRGTIQMGGVRARDGIGSEAGRSGITMTSFFRKLRWLVRRRGREANLHEELQFHIDEEAEERASDGLAKEDAQRSARLDLGNLTSVKEETRSAWSWMWLEQLCQDLSYGVRVLRRAPAFTLGAVAVLALGVGVNLAELQIFD